MMPDKLAFTRRIANEMRSSEDIDGLPTTTTSPLQHQRKMAAEPLLHGRQRTTHDDPNFVRAFPIYAR